MEGPAQTTSYMIAGYAVIFGLTLAYIASLVLRYRNLRQEAVILEEITQANQERHKK